ncbi:MAG: site-specific DNA-methyltransferase [Bacteroidetes bacterium 4484_276]|nr:MAG: site-specific DNA-methyltransferase [Bacteroidetes bacterium 4484_276]
MKKEQKITNDIKAQNKDIEVLKKHFSHCFAKNGNFDFDKFKQELSENEIDFYKESYSMDWLGKSYARLLASDEATTLLKEDEEFNNKDENKNSENLLIKGDNLEVLKHLSNAYYEKVKMIYIDPPYNTGSDGFVYQDDRKFTINEFRNLAGVDEDKAKRILSFVDSNSNSHSAWLTFMYPRLYIAKHLLKEDGVIFISIDDNEVAQLKMLMDEVFGEENFEANIIPIVNPGGRDYKQVAITNEYLLVYSKTDTIELNELPKKAKFKFEDSYGGYNLRELRNRNPKFHSGNRPNLFYPFYINPTKRDNDYCSVSLIKDDEHNIEVKPYNSEGKESVWRWGVDKSNANIVLNNLDLNQVVAKQKADGNWNVYEKNRRDTTKSKSVWDETEMRTENGTRHLRDLFSANYFDHPKPIGLIKRCIQIGANEDDIILDFFAGSGTTTDAVMQLNAEDGGNRKSILAQLPELIDPKKNKIAYDFVKDELKVEVPTIFEITKERLIRASKKIKEETINTKITEKQKEIKDFENQLDIDGKDEKIKQLKAEIKVLINQDLGFKIFETMPIWEDYDFEAEELNGQLKLFDESKLTENDLKSLLVTWKTYDGISLTEDLQEIDLGKYTGYYTSNKLYLTHKGFKTENLKVLLEKIDSDKKFNPTSIIAFGYHFESKNLREIAENIKSYVNKKSIKIDFITRY